MTRMPALAGRASRRRRWRQARVAPEPVDGVLQPQVAALLVDLHAQVGGDPLPPVAPLDRAALDGAPHGGPRQVSRAEQGGVRQRVVDAEGHHVPLQQRGLVGEALRPWPVGVVDAAKAGVGQEALAGRGRLDPARAAGQQRLANGALQALDALGQCLLGEEELGGGAAEVPLLGDLDEGSHLGKVQFHPPQA
jgi:hypothetical protein